MPSTKIHKIITLLRSFFYYTGIWQRGDKPTMKGIRNKLFYSVFYGSFPVSLALGAMQTATITQGLLLGGVAVGTTDFLQRICVFAIEDDDNYAIYNSKVTSFAQLFGAYLLVLSLGDVCVHIVPFVGSEHYLLFDIAFPLDWRNDDIAFYLASLFNSVQCFLSNVASYFTTITCYLLYVCSLRFGVLSRDLKNMGQKKGLKAEQEEERVVKYRNDLHTCIDTHLSLTELTLELGSFHSNVFLLVLATSSMCICGSVYCLAIGMAESWFEQGVLFVTLFYYLCDIFMFTYIGNEITLAHDRLAYSLFESIWIDVSQSTKRSIIIFGEYLRQPLMLTIGKLYPLTLETFTKIMDSAYSMFNILKTQI